MAQKAPKGMPGQPAEDGNSPVRMAKRAARQKETTGEKTAIGRKNPTTPGKGKGAKAADSGTPTPKDHKPPAGHTLTPAAAKRRTADLTSVQGTTASMIAAAQGAGLLDAAPQDQRQPRTTAGRGTRGDRRTRPLPASGQGKDAGATVVALHPPMHEGWGPFHTADATARRLRATPESVVARGLKGSLLMAETVEGVPLFPVWQFREHGMHPRIVELLEIFRDVPVDRWLFVQWATTPNLQLGGLSVVQWLLDPALDEELALAEARHCAWRWSQ